MSKEDYRGHAKVLSKDAVRLVANIFEKHDAAILEEMHDQMKKRDLEVKQLKLTVGKLTMWLGRELGEVAVKELMQELDTNHIFIS